MKLILNKYQAISNISKQGDSLIAPVINKNEEKFIAKWINGIKKDSFASKRLLNSFRYLQKEIHAALPRIIEYNWDDTKESYCIIYEFMNVKSLEDLVEEIDSIPFLKGIAQILSCLKQLSSHNLYHRCISPSNILVNEKHEFYLVDVGIEDVFSTLGHVQTVDNSFAAPEMVDKDKDKGFLFHPDIFSVGKVIDWYFNKTQKSKTDEIKFIIESACKPEPSDRIYYIALEELFEKLFKKKQSEEISNSQFCVLISLANKVFKISLSLLLSDLNDDEFKPKFYVSPNMESNNIRLDIASKNFLINALWLVDVREFRVLSICKKADSPNYEKCRRKGIVLEYPVLFIERSYNSNFTKLDLTEKLITIREEKQIDRGYQNGKRVVNSQLEFYKELLEKELKVLEKNSLRVKYSSFELKDKDKIWFTIQDNKKYSEDNYIADHINKATPPNPEEFEYTLSETADRKKNKKSDKFIGVAYDFNFESRVLKFKDCENLKFDDIPHNGYLFENIIIQEIEKTRQQDAIKIIETHKARNNKLIHYLFNPAELKGCILEDKELEKVFQKDQNNTEFKYSHNQTKAIQNALEREPLTLIQGPPGTGKTTVITEIIFQILDKDPLAKILITSQTNNAVDNVLDNLLKAKIPVVRLCGIKGAEKLSLKKHTLERKIESFREEIKIRAELEWQKTERDFLDEIEQDNILLSPVIKFLISNKDWNVNEEIRKKNWNRKKKELKKIIQRLDCFKDLIDALIDQETFIKALDKKTNCGVVLFFSKLQIYTDWLSVVGSLDENSSVNKKLINSISVFGATANHIAAKKYDKLNLKFDYVIMDESGKATISEALVPIVLADKLVLVGDHRQLRPMITSDREVEEWLKDKYKIDSGRFDTEYDFLNRPSLFEEIIDKLDEDFKCQLDECRRMPKESVLLTSSCFYEAFGDNKIIPIDRALEKEHNLDLKVHSSLIFLDIGNTQESKKDNNMSSYNTLSASKIPEILLGLDKIKIVKNYSIGVITAYKAQSKLIRQHMQNKLQQKNQHLTNIKIDDITVSVVDKFQGLEKDIIIFDLVKSGVGTLGFLTVANRINVALSRHKKLLIIIGNYDWLVHASPFPYNIASVPLQAYLKGINKDCIVQNVKQIFK